YHRSYLQDNSEWFRSNSLTPSQMEGLKARIFRTYPSLVRDVHFYFFTLESNAFDSVLYNEKLDIEHGIDLVIKKNSRLYAVNLYTDTKRAYVGRVKKQYRHQKLEGFTYVELPVEFKGSKKCGEFFLYSERELNNLIKIIGNHDLPPT
ncbi:MAG: hypothetical protein WCJ71_10850, partial [Candidatus Omnitrophota bacterium]